MSRPAWSVVRQFGVQRAGDAAKKSQTDNTNWKRHLRKPNLDECYFKNSECHGANVIVQTALGAMRVCQAHKKHAREYVE
jgi:hypothetical protein